MREDRIICIASLFQSPIFLLFLDCVWQLLQQCPTSFEFSETYLTTLWDAAHVSIFDTFLFDCDRDRYFAMNVSTNFVKRGYVAMG